MASTKEYGYYFEGGKIAIVQRDTSFDNDSNSRDYGPGSDKFQWKSPLESITEGIEYLYSYAPNYKEFDTNDKVASQPTQYKATATSGKLRLKFSNGVNFSSNVGQYILLKNAGRWNGIHKIVAGGSNYIETNTNFTDGSNNDSDLISFGSSISYNLSVSVMEDESYEIDLPIYLQKALIYYIKSKLFEDVGDMKMREFFSREFKRQVEKHNNGRVPGLRVIATGGSAIK